MWTAIVEMSGEEPISTPLSLTESTAVTMPPDATWSAVTEPVVTSDASERVRLTLRNERGESYAFDVADAPIEGEEFGAPAFFDIPATETAPRIIVGVGRLRDGGGGSELACAA